MARVNVDSRAHNDPRFAVLGVALGCPESFAADFALGAMTRLWNECIERGSYELAEWLVNAILKTPKGVEGVLQSDLGETGSAGYIRIRGTRGRIEYLSRKRANGHKFGHLGASHGSKGGRPKKNPHSGGVETHSGGKEKPPSGSGSGSGSGSEDPPTPREPEAEVEPALAPIPSGGRRTRNRTDDLRRLGAYREPEGARPKLSPEQEAAIDRYRDRRNELEREIKAKNPAAPEAEIRAFVSAQLRVEGLA